MFHQQMQVQQKLQTISQMAQQMRQAEAQNVQQLQRLQQLCQECMSDLQSPSFNQHNYGQATFGYQQPQNYSATMGMNMFETSSNLASLATMDPTTYQNSQRQFQQGGYSTMTQAPLMQMQNNALFDRTTMNPDTYQNTMEFMNQKPTASMMSGTSPQLSNIATMGPDTYQASREQFGKGTASLSQIGQQAGIASSALSSGVAMGQGSGSLSSIATMGPDTYQNSQQRLGGSSTSLGSIGQQAGISTKSFNQ